MTKAMYDKLVIIFDNEQGGAFEVTNELLEVAKETIKEPGSEVRRIELTYGGYIVGKTYGQRIIGFSFVGEMWADSKVFRVYNLEYNLDEIDEYEDEDNTRRYDLVTDIVDLSEAKR